MSETGRKSPHVVRKARPGTPTMPISAPDLANLVEGLKEPEAPPEPVFELPDAPAEDDDVLELTVDDEAPAEAKPSRFAHVVRRAPKP
jgi:hypothetical protein